MTKQLVLTLYKTLFRKLKNTNNKQGIEVLKLYAKDNKNLINKDKINYNIQIMIDKLMYLNLKKQKSNK